MTPIQSRANPLFKRLRALAASGQRQRREGVALLEGAHLADAYLNAGGRAQWCVVARGAAARPEVAGLLARIAAAGTGAGGAEQVAQLDDALFDQVSPVANGGVGVMLVVAAPRAALPERVNACCIVLDGVQDAGNAGSILRSAAAAGIRHAFCMPGTANAWSTKVLRAAMGAHFEMTIVEDMDAAALAGRLAVPVAITDSHGTASIHAADLRPDLAWVFGNEGAGVSAAWRARATWRLTIPQPGRIESLNVAAAAAVCLFEQCRQRARQGG